MEIKKKINLNIGRLVKFRILNQLLICSSLHKVSVAMQQKSHALNQDILIDRAWWVVNHLRAFKSSQSRHMFTLRIIRKSLGSRPTRLCNKLRKA